jgi:LDH2 family malate/lactate/ureidoglycolate dehydrogenase
VAIEHIDGVLCPAADLAAFVRSLVAAAGIDAASAEAVSRALVDASSRGVDTHGVRLAPWYLQMIEGGRVNRHPRLSFERKAAAVGHVDADDGFGHGASYRAIEEGVAIARETGLAAITVGRSSHHGATGCYTLAAARQGFAAIGMTHADSAVVPFGGSKPFFGTNPISFAVPAPGEEPMLLDMATSSIPANRIMLRRATGVPLRPDVAVTVDGHATRDAGEASALLPLGGAGFGYKGAGLAAMVDVLCSAFTGMGHGATFAPQGGPDFSQPIPLGHFFLILTPALFQGAEVFDARIGAMLRDLREQPAHPGQRIMAPGDIEKAEATRRARDGVPVDWTTWRALEAAAGHYACAVPAWVPTAPQASDTEAAAIRESAS